MRKEISIFEIFNKNFISCIYPYSSNRVHCVRVPVLPDYSVHAFTFQIDNALLFSLYCWIVKQTTVSYNAAKLAKFIDGNMRWKRKQARARDLTLTSIVLATIKTFSKS